MEQHSNRKKSGELVGVSTEHKKILDEELSAYKKSTGEGSSWEEVKARIRKKR
jgi:hypothetical protein